MKTVGIILIVFILINLACESSQNTNKANSEKFYNKAILLKGEGKYNESLNLFTKAICYDSCFAEAYYDRGYLKIFYLKDIEGGKSDIEKALKIAENSKTKNAGFLMLDAKNVLSVIRKKKESNKSEMNDSIKESQIIWKFDEKSNTVIQRKVNNAESNIR